MNIFGGANIYIYHCIYFDIRVSINYKIYIICITMEELKHKIYNN